MSTMIHTQNWNMSYTSMSTQQWGFDCCVQAPDHDDHDTTSIRPWFYYADVATRIWLLHLWRGGRGCASWRRGYIDNKTTMTSRRQHGNKDLIVAFRLQIMTMMIQPWYDADLAIDDKDLIVASAARRSGVVPTSQRWRYVDDDTMTRWCGYCDNSVLKLLLWWRYDVDVIVAWAGRQVAAA
jgi:hypothetical protein